MSDQEKKKIIRHTELEVYQKAFAAAMKIFEFSKSFPVEEKYSLTDQARRSSRSVCANQAEAWRKRIYSAHFASKLNDGEAGPPKRRHGFSSLSNVDTWLAKPLQSFTGNMNPLSPCSSR
jgi:hypothetical protein